jgi:YesN/AraC family two-component response regulator
MKTTILLVDDDVNVKDTITAAICRDYAVVDAWNCSEAVACLAQGVDLVLADYYLPDGHGLQVLKAIRERALRIPVIIMTGYSSDDLAIQAFRSGVTDFLKKPFQMKYLRSRLSEILGNMSVSEYKNVPKGSDLLDMEGVAAYIRHNYQEDIRRDKLAEMAGMEIHQFSRVFNERFGRSVKTYLNQMRCEHAGNLLRESNLSITEIAHCVGFGSLSQFNRSFKEVFGAMPSDYRCKNYT